MPKFTVDLDVLRHAVKDRVLTQVGDSFLGASITSPVRINDVSFTPTTALAVRVLNRADDKDEDAVFGTHIAYDMQSAWVKYKLSAKAGAKVFAVSASGDVELGDYRIHAATDKAWDALRGDLAEPRSLLSLDDVRALRPGEALTMELGGALSASVSFAWSDALALSGLLDGIAVKLRSGLETSVSVKVTDRFSVVVSRTPDRHYRIAVKKAQSRDHSFGIEVSFGAEASAMPAIDEVLEPLLDRLAEKSEKARDLLAKELRKQLTKVATLKASTGFAYEYARIDENTSIVDFILLDDAKLEDDYTLAVNGDFAKLTALLRQDTDSRTLVRYLNETKLTRRSSSGFSLGIGKWVAVQAKDQSVFQQTTRTSMDGFRLITCKCTRRYDEKQIPQNDFEWIVDLKAQMTEFAETPTTRDFDYGLHVMAVLERAALREDDLERMLDFAAMWDVCTPSRDDAAEAIGKKATIRVQLMLEREALAKTVGAFGDIGAWAEPLAMAMPFSSTFAERSSFASRRDVYTDAWRAWLAGTPFDAMALLRPRIRSGLVLFEQRGLPGSFTWTSGEGHTQLRARLDAFMRGARRLGDAMTSAQAPEAIATAYDGLQQFWTQRLYIAACGRYLVDRARDAGADVRTSLQIEYADTTIVT
ncbi:MAG TPA: hypothetical protein VHK90_07010 [Thermoanaerobaculia bacterium]|nr:hypothetical protein [Thermoanaerobaculia bacterium]